MRKRLKYIAWSLWGWLALGVACSQNPQLPSEHYTPQLVLFGVLAPGSYSLSNRLMYTPLRYNFFVVQRTLKRNETVVLLPMDHVQVFLDSIPLIKVGDLHQDIFSPTGSELSQKTPIYSFDQKQYPIQALHQYTVRVTAPGYAPLSATTSVPEKPTILEPTSSAISVSSSSIRVRWKKARGAAGYRIQVWCEQSITNFPCDEDWVDENVNQYEIPMDDLGRSVGDTLWIDIQAVDWNYKNYDALKQNFFSSCLTQKEFNVQNGLGVLGSLNMDRKEIVLTK